MERRDFLRFCAVSAATAAAGPSLAADVRPQFYEKAKLIDADGRPLRARAVPAGRNLIFHYPYASTPCFLLNLGRPAKGSAVLMTADKRPYEWRGGVGAQRSIVAYSAICAHKMTYPTRDISFISFRAEGAMATEKPRFSALFDGKRAASAPQRTRPVYMRKAGWTDAAIYPFDTLAPDRPLNGPAIVERESTTIWLPPKARATLDPYGNLAIDLE